MKREGETFVKRTWRFWGALWAGKKIALLLRLLGKNGTTLPGRVALRIHPQIIRDLATEYQEGIIIVTGTNGKTTTANLLAQILRTSGRDFAFNQAGANLVTGITGALLLNTTWWGKTKVHLALLEVDEATVPKLCEQVKPQAAIITNFFRDQLDRYGELDTTVRLVKNSLPTETDLILNADDPLVAQFGIERQHTLYFGVDKTPESKTQSTETREARFCPQCGAPLDYSLFHYGQLGIYHCPECDFERPDVQVLAEDIHPEEFNLKFRIGATEYTLALQGYYNLYNALAAITAAKRLGIREQEIERGIRQFIPQAGRMERFDLPGGKITLTLVKNPTGFNQVLHTVFSMHAKQVKLLIIINDLAADGRDISWLWDVQFEVLGEHAEQIQEIICSGLRAEDMALRLKYAGVPVQKLKIEHNVETAVEQLQAAGTGEEPTFIFPTYTALFPVRKILEKLAVTEETQVRREKSEA